MIMPFYFIQWENFIYEGKPHWNRSEENRINRAIASMSIHLTFRQAINKKIRKREVKYILNDANANFVAWYEIWYINAI